MPLVKDLVSERERDPLRRIAPHALTLILACATLASAEPYTVRRGDNLSVIADRYNTSVAAIKRVNHLRTDVIQPGQVLEIPTPTEEYKPHAEHHSYTVRSGDTLGAIGHKFGVPYGRIKEVNRLRSNTILPGQVLLIPAIPGEGIPLDVNLPSQAATTPVSTDSAPTTSVRPQARPTTVTAAASGESTTVAASAEDEAETVSDDYEPDETAVPETQEQPEEAELEPFTHVVRPGNTLGALATQYQTSVSEIKALNGLTSDLIRVGQRLRIPGRGPVDTSKFHVRHTAMQVSTDDLTTLARLIQSEVPANAPYEGAVAVGAVVLNRVRSSRFPNTILKVVGQRGKTKRGVWVYQFSGYNDHNYRAPVKDYAWRAAREALAGADPVAGADHYYNPFLVAPRWARSFTFIRRIGATSRTAHDFYHSDPPASIVSVLSGR